MEMNEKRLDAIMHSYGAAPERWPPEERLSALTLLKRSDRARKSWVEAAAMDSLMVPAQAPQPSEDLVRRLRAIPDGATGHGGRAPAWRQLAGSIGRFRPPAAAAFAAVAIAFAIGLAAPSPFGLPPVAPTLEAALISPVAEEEDSGTEIDIAIDDGWVDESDTSDIDDDMELAVLDLALD